MIVYFLGLFCDCIVSVTDVCYHFRFGIDPSVNSFIRATWQGYYMGPWRAGGRFLMKGGNHGGKGLW